MVNLSGQFSVDSERFPSGLWAVSWNLVIAHEIKYVKNYHRVLQIFRNMKGIDITSTQIILKTTLEKGVQPNVITYSLMIRCFMALGDRDQVENIFSEAQRIKLNLPFLHSYMKAAIKFRDQNLFKIIWKDYFRIYQLEPSQQSYSLYLEGANEFGFFNEAWNEIKNTNFKDNFMVNYNYVRFLMNQ